MANNKNNQKNNKPKSNKPKNEKIVKKTEKEEQVKKVAKEEVKETKKEEVKEVEKVEKKSAESEELAKIKEENRKLKEEREKKLKEEEKKESKELFKKIWNYFWWAVLIIWMIVCLIDFFNVQKDHDPYFCFNKNTVNYTSEDESTIKYGTGNVTSCYGLGYKIYRYNRENFKALEFGPFWSKDRTAKIDD